MGTQENSKKDDVMEWAIGQPLVMQTKSEKEKRRRVQALSDLATSKGSRPLAGKLSPRTGKKPVKIKAQSPRKGRPKV